MIEYVKTKIKISYNKKVNYQTEKKQVSSINRIWRYSTCLLLPETLLSNNIKSENMTLIAT